MLDALDEAIQYAADFVGLLADFGERRVRQELEIAAYFELRLSFK
jgi:hypothetical protein